MTEEEVEVGGTVYQERGKEMWVSQAREQWITHGKGTSSRRKEPSTALEL